MAEKRKPRKSVSRLEITAAALQIIDNQGLEALSMRRLAEALSVFPTALYWYFPARNDILEAVAQHVMAGIAPASDLAWQPWLRTFAANLRAAIVRHPNVAPLIGGQLVSNAAGDLEVIEGLLGALSRAGLTGEELVQGYNMVMGALVGFVTQEFARPPEAADPSLRDRVTELARRADPLRHPLLTQNAEALLGRSFVLRWQNGQHQPMGKAYDRLIDSLIAGLEAGRP
ncbi:TetR/AcrR family transcriptional regulator [Pararhodobacter sp. CCB-MM2]|uniref:TetR/AcrR family transcriptional regulator n=1 Tax=Pararhodobacter sp. CCB-MM2 TaxID=1786003 RepID=UPI000829C28E|nr:TetR/AcrR family transcriptional regulator C-terminal domain-containing protein [Pararhodobacter sp. CCB-MM2]